MITPVDETIHATPAARVADPGRARYVNASGLRLHVAKDGGHLMLIDEPHSAVAAIGRFLDQHDESSAR